MDSNFTPMQPFTKNCTTIIEKLVFPSEIDEYGYIYMKVIMFKIILW